MHDQRPRWVLGHRITPIETIGDYGMLLVEMGQAQGPPPHHHEDASELFYITEGTLEVMCDGEWTRLERGQSFNVPQGSVHTFRKDSDNACSFITAFSPRGFERFFFEFGVPVEQPDAEAMSASKEMVARVVSGCAAFGMILAPPP